MNFFKDNKEELNTSQMDLKELKLIKMENKSSEENQQMIVKVKSEIEDDIKSFDNETQKEIRLLIETLEKKSPDLWYLISKIYSTLQKEKDAKNIKNNIQTGGNNNSFVVDRPTNQLGPTIVRINKNHIQGKVTLIMSIIVFVLSAFMLIESAMQHGETVTTFVSSLYDINKEDSLLGVIFKLLIANQRVLENQVKDVIKNFPVQNIQSPYLITTGVYSIVNVAGFVFGFSTLEGDYLTEAIDALKQERMAFYTYSLKSIQRSLTQILPISMMSLLMISMSVGMINPATTINVLNNLLGIVTNKVQLVYEDTPMAIENNSNKKINNQSGGKRSRKNKSKSLKKSKQMKRTRKK